MRGVLRGVQRGARLPRQIMSVPLFDPVNDVVVWHTSYFTEGTEFAALGLADGAAVETVPDESSTHDATQATAAKRGTKETVNGVPVLRQDGVDDFWQTASFTLNEPNTFVIVAKYDDADTNDRYMVGSGTSFRHVVRSNSGFWGLFNSVTLVDGADDSDWHIFVAIFNGASSRLYVDGGAAAASGDAGASNLSGGLVLGANSGGGSGWDGDRVFTGLYDGLMSDADINELGNGLVDRYGAALGITWTDI